MTAIFVPLLLFVTAVASVSFGVLAAYVTVFTILHAFGQPARAKQAKRSQLVLVPSQNQVGGD